MESTRRRYRVKSPARFVSFIVIVLLMIMAAAGYASGSFVSTATTTDEYMQYAVESGDTLWDIAEQISDDNADVRKVVHVICQLNDVSADELQPGMVLTVPAQI